MSLLQFIEQISSDFFGNIKIVEKAIMGYQGSYVELLTLLSIALLAVTSSWSPRRGRQIIRRTNQICGIVIFVFVVFTCLGVFGMIRNFHRGLNEIGRENIVAFYYMSVPLTVLVTTLLFGGIFCGWICPTGSIQQFTGRLTRSFWRRRRLGGFPFSPPMAAGFLAALLLFLSWIWRLSVTRSFFVEDACIYWSEAVLIILFFLLWKFKERDPALRRLRTVSFWIIVAGAFMNIRITSPVHLGFAKIYDPASFNATAMVIAAALFVPRFWCRYLCPWRLAISWAAARSPRKIVFDKDKCTACGKCEDVCEMDALEKGRINPGECIMCLECVDNCPHKALDVNEIWTLRSP